MAEQSTVKAQVISTSATSYGPFTDKETGQIVQGVSRRLHLLPQDGDDPVEIRVNDDQWSQVVDLPFGADVLASYSLFAQSTAEGGAQLVRRLLAIEEL